MGRRYLFHSPRCSLRANPWGFVPGPDAAVLLFSHPLLYGGALRLNAQEQTERSRLVDLEASCRFVFELDDTDEVANYFSWSTQVKNEEAHSRCLIELEQDTLWGVLVAGPDRIISTEQSERNVINVEECDVRRFVQYCVMPIFSDELVHRRSLLTECRNETADLVELSAQSIRRTIETVLLRHNCEREELCEWESNDRGVLCFAEDCSVSVISLLKDETIRRTEIETEECVQYMRRAKDLFESEEAERRALIVASSRSNSVLVWRLFDTLLEEIEARGAIEESATDGVLRIADDMFDIALDRLESADEALARSALMHEEMCERRNEAAFMDFVLEEIETRHALWLDANAFILDAAIDHFDVRFDDVEFNSEPTQRRALENGVLCALRRLYVEWYVLLEEDDVRREIELEEEIEFSDVVVDEQ